MVYKPLLIGELVAPVPIVQGGMGVGISLGRLAGTVAACGGVGMISSAQIGFREPDFEKDPKSCNLRAMKNEYEKAREIADKAPSQAGIIGFNIMVALRHYEEYVRRAVEIGAELIVSGAGLPTELPAYVKGSATKIAPIVSSDKSAKVILKYWDRKHKRTADMVVIEGPLAGGHLGFSKEELEKYMEVPSQDAFLGESGTEKYAQEIKAICATVKEYEDKYGCPIPVVVAGGIDTAEEMKRIMDLGVQGVQVASRFVTTEECDADIAYKMAYIKATKDDIQIVKSPVGMPGRAIMNSFMKRVMSGEHILPGKCLGCLRNCNPKEIPYCITEALVHAAKGEVDEALLFCGANAYKAQKLETVKEVMDSLVVVCT